jgi:hypothetical protein
MRALGMQWIHLHYPPPISNSLTGGVSLKASKSVGGIALRGQSGRTTRTTLPLVDGSEDVARLRLARQRL